MTREEALKLLENEIYKWSMDWDEREDGLDYTEAIEIAIAALRPVSREQPTLTPPNGWVSVEERLPEPTYCVLVYTTDYSIEVDARGSDGEWMSYEVTHWMPLPSPPDRRPPEGEI